MNLDRLPLDNSFTQQLPADPSTDNHPRQVTGAAYSWVAPRPFPSARLLAFSREMAHTLGLSDEDCRSQRFVEIFSGTQLAEGMKPHAQCYGGHQFGNWAGQLGDGRAINLGAVLAPDGQHWELQLKGAGPTPYSRTADGYAVLRSSVREFLCSEAMYHLGVPTTRALSLIATGEEVMRDMFYDGHPAYEPGAVVCRVAPSFLRLGSWQIFAARQEQDLLRQLADYSIQRDFPDLPGAGNPDHETYLAWFETVCQRTCSLMVEWMRVGFVHGVMNTDNLSVLGLTIDYGPYGWLEDYDPDWTPNTTDAGGRRYRFGQQPQIALWNLVQFANAIYPLVGDAAPLERILEEYMPQYERQYHEMMAGKLGLDAEGEETSELIAQVTRNLCLVETDMTLFFRDLADFDPTSVSTGTESSDLVAPVREAFYDPDLPQSVVSTWATWFRQYAGALNADSRPETEKRAMMNRHNPRFVLRNWLAQQAIDRATDGDLGGIEELMEALKTPYEEQPDKAHLAQKRPEWARHRAGCSMLSCSS